MKRYVFASHSQMAAGMKQTLEFLTKTDEIYELSAYNNEQQDEDLSEKIAELLGRFSSDDLVIVMTDIMAGSVNQQFYPYVSEKLFLIAGINVPLAMSFALVPEESLTQEKVQELVEEARNQMIFVNQWQREENEEDE